MVAWLVQRKIAWLIWRHRINSVLLEYKGCIRVSWLDIDETTVYLRRITKKPIPSFRYNCRYLSRGGDYFRQGVVGIWRDRRDILYWQKFNKECYWRKIHQKSPIPVPERYFYSAGKTCQKDRFLDRFEEELKKQKEKLKKQRKARKKRRKRIRRNVLKKPS